MSATVRLVDLPARHRRHGAAIEAAVAEVLSSGRYIGGPVHDAFLAALAQRHGVSHAVGAGSGTAALRLLLQAAGVGPGDEVVVPAVSFWSTAEAVLQLGARPVVVDVDPETGLLDPAAVEAAWRPSVAAVLPVWLFGNAPPELRLPEGVLRLDDAAQAVGRDLSAHPAALSFYPTKVLGAAGDAGAILTTDAALARRARDLGSHGMSAPHLHHALGGHVGDNNRLDALQAAVLTVHLSDLDRRLARRQAIARRYADTLGLPAVPHDAESPVSVYCLRVEERDARLAALQRLGVDAGVYYPRPMGAQPALAGRARVEPCPAAEAFCQRALALPCHAELSDADVERVVRAVRGEA